MRASESPDMQLQLNSRAEDRHMGNMPSRWGTNKLIVLVSNVPLFFLFLFFPCLSSSPKRWEPRLKRANLTREKRGGELEPIDPDVIFPDMTSSPA
ncbi:hypothetical protein BDV37DRAFT_4730 [Aspergillus pseudonomiae]|uniref:Uncharacterized protein n=1 Tax=Aspergillus pseudonomiae TaxID=1506151 RepID=A0A5N7DMN0_9EURO|nr:uncharacterized protein BDV37DRAFT_4730 [Aspergillus pseudonomiae]KAE8407575.1 hypothetical protein BDV37DRAFT_4730 [Aspergillus pseudonomiae]